MFAKILFVTDNAEIATEPLQYLVDLYPEAAFHMLCIINTDVPLTDMLERIYLSVSKEKAEKVVATARERMEAVGMKEVETSWVKGRPVPEVLKYIEEQGIELLVVENYDSQGYHKKKMDAWVDRFLSKAKVPVLNISGTRSLRSPRTILLVDTNWEVTERTSDIAFDIANRFSTKLRVLNVVQAPGEGIAGDRMSFKRYSDRAEEVEVPMIKLADLEAGIDYGTWFTEQGEEFDLIVMDTLRKKGLLGKRLHPALRAVLANIDLPVIVSWEEGS